VLVAASTECFPSLSLSQTVDTIVDLEYTSLEIDIHEDGNHLRPSVVAANLESAITACRNTHRASVVSYSVQINAEGEEHYRQFAACCRLAKATKVVTLTVPSGELGTPFNQEVEHLQRLVTLAEADGVRVAIKSQIGRLSEDPDTVVVLCDNVKGLAITLDPSHYICGPHAGGNFEQIPGRGGRDTGGGGSRCECDGHERENAADDAAGGSGRDWGARIRRGRRECAR